MELSNRFNDRQNTPKEEVIYWTEYVLKHKGAHHLKTSALQLPRYQYLLLDVIISVILGLLLILVLIYLLLKTIKKFFYNFTKSKSE